MSDIFTLQPLEIQGQRLEFSIPYSVPHSELFTAIVARQEIEMEPTEALNEGIVESFESTRKQLQQVFLFGQQEAQDMMLDLIEEYLNKYPDERISGYVDYVRGNRPSIDFFGSEQPIKGQQSKKNAKEDKKRKEKLKKKSRKINRK